MAFATFTSFEQSYNLSIFGFYQLTANGKEQLLNSYALMALTVMIMLLTLYILFKFKNRILQIRLGSLNMLLLSGLLVLIFYHFDNAKTLITTKLPDPDASPRPETTYGLGILMPVLAVIFQFMAIRATRKDEALVKSADRIR